MSNDQNEISNIFTIYLLERLSSFKQDIFRDEQIIKIINIIKKDIERDIIKHAHLINTINKALELLNSYVNQVIFLIRNDSVRAYTEDSLIELISVLNNDNSFKK